MHTRRCPAAHSRHPSKRVPGARFSLPAGLQDQLEDEAAPSKKKAKAKAAARQPAAQPAPAAEPDDLDMDDDGLDDFIVDEIDENGQPKPRRRKKRTSGIGAMLDSRAMQASGCPCSAAVRLVVCEACGLALAWCSGNACGCGNMCSCWLLCCACLPCPFASLLHAIAFSRATRDATAAGCIPYTSPTWHTAICAHSASPDAAPAPPILATPQEAADLFGDVDELLADYNAKRAGRGAGGAATGEDGERKQTEPALHRLSVCLRLDS